MKSLKDIIEKAGETVGKVESSDKSANSKAIVKGLVQSFNRGRAQTRRPMQEVFNFEDEDSS